MSTGHRVSIGHHPTGSPSESLNTRIMASHHTRAMHAQADLMSGYPWGCMYSEMKASQEERTVVRLSPFCSHFRVLLVLSGASGNIQIRYYGAGGNVNQTLEWVVTNGTPERLAITSALFSLDPVTTSAPSTALLRLVPSVDITCWQLQVECLTQ